MRSAALVILSLVVGVGIGAWIGGGSGEPSTNAFSAYICPMHPTVVSDRSGSCPICAMDLVPSDGGTESGAGGGHGSEVRIDPTTVQNIGVKTQLVERTDARGSIRTVGRVAIDETRLVDVTTKVSGWVEELFVDYTGKPVTEGQVLFHLYSPGLVAAQEEFLSTLTFSQRLASGRTVEGTQGAFDLLESARARLRFLDMSQEGIDRLATRRDVPRLTAIRSPGNGIVLEKAVVLGAHVVPGKRLYRIADLSSVWVEADIYEQDLPFVEVGQEAEVELAYQPGEIYRGSISYIYPTLDPGTRTATIRMEFANPELALKPDMYATVRVLPGASRQAIMVPAQAVIRSGERNVAIVGLGDGRFAPREVRLGMEADGRVEILGGLEQGERIVTSSQFLIDSESNLKAALSAMAPQDVDPNASDSGRAPAPPTGGHDH